MLSRLLREPLVYFLLAGTGLFWLTANLGGEAQRIVVTEAELNRLNSQWQAQMGQPPSDTELAALVEQWIREEIYYREAKAMGLDDDDIIIRRRLAQKLTFLTEDLIADQTLRQEDLEAYYREHADRYSEPRRLSFSHRYYSRERRQNAAADARADLEAARNGEVPSGDPFMLQAQYSERSQRQIGELFGSEFAAEMVALPVGSWQGPIRSAYGWHLVKIEQHRPERQPEFSEVAERVATDYRQQQRRRANEDFYAALRERYDIVKP
jgi:peptidyl-prolyl cis-trans isomerase C